MLDAGWHLNACDPVPGLYIMPQAECSTKASTANAIPIEAAKSTNADDATESLGLIYQLNDTPAWYVSILLGIQHCLLAIGGLIGIPLILAQGMCMGNTDTGYLGRAMVLNSLFFISGIMTFLQTTFGTRLPILQGASFTYLPSALAILALPHNKCPDEPLDTELTNGTELYNDTDGTWVGAPELWMRRMREIQGAIAVASTLEVILGMTGAVGFLMRFIGPITVAPSIALIGLSLLGAASGNASGQWGIAFFTIVMLILFSQYLRNFKMPFPFYTRQKSFHFVRSNFFKLFPVLITIALAWILCLILTAAGAFPNDRNMVGYRARTDAKLNVLINSPWFRFPYPGQWGLPVVSAAGTVGMLAAVISSIIESIGDYYACARLSGAPPVPTHAVNRGIAIEGFGGIIAGVLGTGSGTTSYSQNIAAIAITRVASRRVLQAAGIFFFIVGMVGKVGAVLVMIPDPIVGGLFCIMFGMITSVGLSNLQHVDLNSPRNLFILGFSLFMGLMVPGWVKANTSAISTGADELDQIFRVLLETSIFVGGAIAAFLDNTLPGTMKERGMLTWNKPSVSKTENMTEADEKAYEERIKQDYDLPCSTDWRFSKYVPFLPEFDRNMRSRKQHNGKAKGSV